MKLYFPTSSLNFNDIFATESISPKNFYTKRSFGTKRHFKTEMSFSDNCITLFSKVPYFKLCERSLSGLEEHPIIFEIDLDTKEYELTKISNDIYITAQTIYLNKHNTNVMFFSHDNMNTVLAKEKIVNETKTVQKYIDRFEVKKNLENQIFIIPHEKTSSIIFKDTISVEMKNDRFFNNVKGFYYAYISRRYIEGYNKISLLHEANIEGVLKIEELINFYKKMPLEENEILRGLIEISLKCAKKSFESTKMKFDEVKNLLDVFKLNNKNEVYFNNSVLNQNDEAKLYQIITNCILCNPKTKVGDISKEEIVELISVIGQRISEEFGIKSNYREDCIEIYKKIKDRVFDIDTSHINSNVLQNFLVFVLKYDNIDEMDSYLKSKNIQNSFIAYSFLGAFLGFSGLSRIITHELFTSNSKELFKVTDSIMNKFRNSIWNNHQSCSKEDINSHYVASLLDLDKSNKNEYDCINIKKQIFYEFQRIRKDDKIKKLIKKQSLIIGEKTEIRLEEYNSNIEITILDKKNDIIINLCLIHRSNLSKEKIQIFKNKLEEIGIINEYKLQGKYLTYEYNKTVKDGVSMLNLAEEKYLLECLKTI